MAEIAATVVETSGAEIRIRRADDGHFWVNGEVNGRPVRFLVDSGATVTMLDRATAARVGIAPDDSFGVMISTANGTAMADRGRAGKIRVGPIERGDSPSTSRGAAATPTSSA